MSNVPMGLAGVAGSWVSPTRWIGEVVEQGVVLELGYDVGSSSFLASVYEGDAGEASWDRGYDDVGELGSVGELVDALGALAAAGGVLGRAGARGVELLTGRSVLAA